METIMKISAQGQIRIPKKIMKSLIFVLSLMMTITCFSQVPNENIKKFSVDIEGIKDIYKTGKGRVIMRGKTSTEEKKGKESIIISEIPYMVNKSLLITPTCFLGISGRQSYAMLI